MANNKRKGDPERGNADNVLRKAKEIESGREYIYVRINDRTIKMIEKSKYESEKISGIPIEKPYY